MKRECVKYVIAKRTEDELNEDEQNEQIRLLSLNETADVNLTVKALFLETITNEVSAIDRKYKKEVNRLTKRQRNIDHNLKDAIAQRKTNAYAGRMWIMKNDRLRAIQCEYIELFTKHVGTVAMTETNRIKLQLIQDRVYSLSATEIGQRIRENITKMVAQKTDTVNEFKSLCAKFIATKNKQDEIYTALSTLVIEEHTLQAELKQAEKDYYKLQEKM